MLGFHGATVYDLTIRAFTSPQTRGQTMTTEKKGVAVLSLYTPNYADVGEFTEKSKREYAKRHGYTPLLERESVDLSRAPTWGKIMMLSAALMDHDIAFWIDADAMILDLSISVHDLLAQDDQESGPSDLYISKDHNGINCGVFLMRSTDTAARFLEDVWERTEFKNHYWHEQAAMMALLAEKYPIKVTYLPKRAINSYPSDYGPGDFIIHAAGQRDRLAVLRKYADTMKQ
jgi:hypothetical protein